MDFESFRSLLDLLVKVVDASSAVDVDSSWGQHPGPLGTKFFFHMASVDQLAQGTAVESMSARFVDGASMVVVVRAALETYLTFHHLFAAPEKAAEREFRVRVWQLGGLLDRQRFPASIQEHTVKLEQERDRAEQLRREVESSPVYAVLSDSEKKKARKGEFRLAKQWRDLAEAAGFSLTMFDATYRYLCSYAHTSQLSVMQIQQSAGSAHAISLAETCMAWGAMLMAEFINVYRALFPCAQNAFDAAPAGQRDLAFIYAHNRDVIEAHYGNRSSAGQ